MHSPQLMGAITRPSVTFVGTSSKVVSRPPVVPPNPTTTSDVPPATTFLSFVSTTKLAIAIARIGCPPELPGAAAAGVASVPINSRSDTKTVITLPTDFPLLRISCPLSVHLAASHPYKSIATIPDLPRRSQVRRGRS